MPNKKKSDSKLQGVNRLVVEATLEITDLVEAMHRRIVHPPFLPSTPIQHFITAISGVVYNSVRKSTKYLGTGSEKALGRIASLIGDIKETDKRETLNAVLNGVIGDHLEKSDNPLKIDMQFRHNGHSFKVDTKGIKKTYPVITSNILLMLHGSCMNDLQWTKNEHNHGIALAKELGKTPVFLHYNSGRHVSTNGKELQVLLANLIAEWPVPVEEITILAHSLGGLVTRSALHYGQEQKSTWTKLLKKIIFLGTPHHGAPLEKAGNYFEVVLKSIPYSKPFARLAKVRSAGVTDLRYGNLLDEDWQDIDQFKLGSDHRQHIPLPNNIACYSVAGVKGKPKKSGSTKLQGDSMVLVKSALGQHKKASKSLNFKEDHTFIAYGTNHTGLLSNQKVYTQIKQWMA
jgi:pimeloyl-ACP methyl ester carboxylesterase